jgi:hypothetical protein
MNTRFQSQKPAPGSEAALRRDIDGLMRGEPIYDQMIPSLVDLVRPQAAQLEARLTALGPLQSVSFMDVGPGGQDIYEAVFAKGRTTWGIAMALDGKIQNVVLMPLPPAAPALTHDRSPTPGAEAAVRRIIDENLRGQPNYDQMSPALAYAVRQQLPGTQRILAALGPMQSVSFRGVDPQDRDVYEVAFAKGTTEWSIAMSPDGRIQTLNFRQNP